MTICFLEPESIPSRAKLVMELILLSTSRWGAAPMALAALELQAVTEPFVKFQ